VILPPLREIISLGLAGLAFFGGGALAMSLGWGHTAHGLVALAVASACGGAARGLFGSGGEPGRGDESRSSRER